MDIREWFKSNRVHAGSKRAVLIDRTWIEAQASALEDLAELFFSPKEVSATIKVSELKKWLKDRARLLRENRE